MMPFSHAMQMVATVLTTAFVAGLWQGLALTLLASALLRLMPRASAGLRHTLLLASFAVALLLPWARLAAPHTVPADESHAIPVASWIAGCVAILWIAAAAMRALQLFLAWRHLRAVRREATPVAIDGLEAFTAGGRRARLCVSSAVDSPTILGFRQPALLLPAWMAPTLSGDELRQIALHECEHLRRGDDWVNLLVQLGLVLSPLNPGLLWLNRRIGVQRELACDAAVVASTGRPIAYASCLTGLAEQRLQQRGRLRLALAAWERKSELAQRVHALLQQPARWTARQSGLASAVAGALLLTASVGLARAPRFIRVVNPIAASTGEVAAIAAPPQLLAPAGMTLASTQNAPPMRMVQAVYSVKPTAPAARRTVNRRSIRRKPVLPERTTNPIAMLNGQPHMLRTSDDASADSRYRQADRGDDAPVRMVTAEFTTPYVAVPVANGWLLIEL